jgi:hypothetical protein
MRLNGPEQMLRIRTPMRLEQRVTRVRTRLDVKYDDGVYMARVEHGRWIADCPCGAGVAVHPEWVNTGCLECGRWWPVAIPDAWRDIEDVLMARPKQIQRGWIGETVRQLEDENERHGVPARSRRGRG